MPYRILMIAPTSFFGDYGCHVRILEETLALQKLGHEVLIVTYPRGRDLPNVHIERTIPVPWRVAYEVGSSRHKIALDLLLIPRVLRAARRFKPDLIHAHLHEGALIGALLARLINRPLVFDFQGSLTGEMVDHHFLNPNGAFYRPVRALERMIDHLPQVILTSAPQQARNLADQFGVPPQRIVHLPDAVNPSWFQPLVDQSGGSLTAATGPQPDRPNRGEGQMDAPEGKPRRRPRQVARLRKFLGIPRGRPAVVYLGLLADYQGVGLLIQAAAEILKRGTDAHFVIMGYPGVRRYADLAASLGIAHRVSLPGRIPYDDAPTWLAIGDVAVAPKLSSTEGNGKILNYMASGLPVVAFDNPVSREYLGADGVFAPPGDVKALAAAIDSLLCDPIRARELGRRLRARAIENYSWDLAALKIQEVYETALQSHRPAHAPAPRSPHEPAPHHSPNAE